ncbi:unnamed protein product [Eretmochelys imbricata]
MDHLQVTGARETLQPGLTEALACVQAQQLLLNIAKAVTRAGENGNGPQEIQHVFWSNATKFEKEKQQWWKMVNFTYEHANETIVASILPLRDATEEIIHPPDSFGNVCKQFPNAAYGKYQMGACKRRAILFFTFTSLCGGSESGFTCTTGVWEETHLCLDPHEGKCNYRLHHPMHFQTSAIVVIDSHCLCIRTLCKHVH